MEKSVAFDFPLEPLENDRPNDQRDAVQPKTSNSKNVCRIAVAAVIAALVLAVVGIVAIIVFRPSASASKSVSAIEETESLRQDIADLKQLLLSKVNSSQVVREISKLRQEMLEDTNTDMRKIQLYQLNFNQELHQQLNDSLRQDVADLKQLYAQVNSSVSKLRQEILEDINTDLREIQLQQFNFNQELYQQLNHSHLSNQQQLNSSVQKIQELQYASLDRINELQFSCCDGSNSSIPSSCKSIFEQDPTATTGTYWLNTRDGIIRVTCNFNVQLPPPRPVRGWQEIANIDMSNPTDSCPSPLNETISPSRRCEKSSGSAGCDSVFFPTYNVPFSKLCGRAVGYSIGSADALRSVFGSCGPSGCETIDEPYVDGLSITYSSECARVHVWTFAAQTRGSFSHCPCGNAAYTSPSFVGDSYYCEVAQNNNSPLWEGEGCTDRFATDAPCCENPNLPWFCREFDQPIVTDNIEVRICTDQYRSDERIEFDLLKLYIQ